MKKFLLIVVLLFSVYVNAQIVVGPMLAHTEFRTATIWLQVEKNVTKVEIIYTDKNSTIKKTVKANLTGGEFNIATAVLTGLQPGNSYNYSIVIDAKPTSAKGTVTTQSLWQWRKEPPTFSFLTGSCAYINQPEFDRPGKPYGNDTSIFETMAKEKADFMLWLGDNWYTREVDYYSEWGLHYRPSFERAKPFYANFLKAMPHYAIWDDHDYGWNDADKSYPLKQTSLEVFKKFWANPSYGENNEGIYTKFTWNDVDVFLLDDRWFRSNDDVADSINGKPNKNKEMYGKKQMEWLKNALLQSNNNNNISFRIIATGSQVLNPMSPFDCFRHFSVEYNEMMNFIKQNKIKGLLFFTGDRHHSEVIKLERENAYPLYDVTSSPLTSGSHKFGGTEKDNPYRVAGIDNIQNYTRVTITGTKKNRNLKIEFMDGKGNALSNWNVNAEDLK